MITIEKKRGQQSSHCDRIRQPRSAVGRLFVDFDVFITDLLIILARHSNGVGHSSTLKGRCYLVTERQKKFAEYYAQCGNTVQSALQAGYSENYANANACKLLENVRVAEYIRQLSEEAQDKRIITVKERQALLSDIAKDKQNEMSDRIRAIDTLNKMTGEYTTKIQAEVKTSEKLSDIFAQIGGEGLEE